MREYLKDLTAGRAYERAGYLATGRVAESVASRLLTVASVRQRIAYLEAEAAARAGLTQTEVLRVTKVLALAQVNHFYVTADGELAGKEDAPDGVMLAVASVKRRTRERLEDGEVVERWWEIEFRLWNKPEILRLASQHLKLIGSEVSSGAAIAVKVMGPGGETVEVVAAVGGGR